VLSRYRDINKIIEYIEIKNIEENITEANGANINEIATNYVSQNFSKKLGKKKLWDIKKKTLETLKSESLKHYCEFLTLRKQINYIQKHDNYEIYTMPQEYFNKIPKFPAPSEFNMNNDLLFITDIQSIDRLISETMMFNNIQKIVDE